MIVASILLAALCGASPEAEITALVDQLGSDRYVQRQEASQELEKRGREALPALRTARDSKDPEVRARATALIDKIENLLMVQPTVVRLDFKNAPLPAVVKEFSSRSGINLSLMPENSPLWQSRRVTLTENEPVPFWTALDRLCREGQLQHNSAAPGGAGPRGSVIQLFAGGNSATPAPSSDHGPFRVNVLGIHYQRDLQFGQYNHVFAQMPPGAVPPLDGAANQRASVQFYVNLQILAEPRMVLTQSGALQITEAVDEKGQSLLVPTNGNAAVRNSGFFGYSSGLTSLQLQAHLRYPEKPGQKIKTLRGSLPVTVSARKDDALVVNLADAKGKTFKSEEITLTVHDLQFDPNQQRTTIELSLASNSPPSDDGPAGRFGNAAMFARMNTPQNQMEILDANDRPYPQWFPSSTQIDNDRARMTLMLVPADGVGPPAKIRYYEMARASADVPFEFTDVPMP